MKSTGEVMGIAGDFPTAFGKAQAAAGVSLPAEGTVFITVTDTDKPAATQLAARFHDLGFEIIATRGTAQAISRMGIPVSAINKIAEGSPHVVDYIRDDEVDMVINTPTGSGARSDGYEIRTAAVRRGDPLHHDDDRRLGGGAGDLRRRASGARSRSRSRSSMARLRRRQRRVADGPACSAPFGRRRLRGRRQRGDRRLPDRLGARRATARCRAPGSSTCSPASAGAGADGRPVPAARLLGRRGARPAPDGVRLDFLLEAVGPGTERLAGARARARALRVTGPLGRPVLGPGGARARAPPGRSWSAAGSGSRRWRSCAASSPTAASPQRVAARLSRPRALGRAGAVSLLGGAPRVRGRPHRPPGLRHRPARGPARGRRRRRRPPSTRAARRRCSRRCARSAPSAAWPPSSRWRRRWPAASAPASAARCRSPTGGYMRLCVDGPTVNAADRIESALVAGSRALTASARSSSAGSRSQHPIINGSGTFDAIAARRAFGEALDERFPFSAFVSKTITPEPRAGNPPPRLYETPAGMINSIGLPNKGLEGFLAEDLPQLARLPVPLIVSVMATSREGFARAGRGGRRPRRGRGDRAQRLLPERQVRADRRRAAGRDRWRCARRCAR